MTSLVGLAFTSPAVAVMVIDRLKFRVHFYQQKPDDLYAFVQDEDERLPVVLLSDVNDFYRVSQVEGVHTFLLSEDPRVLDEIPGCNLLDAKSDPKYPGYQKVMITPEDLNSALLSDAPFEVPEEILSSLSELGDDISFRELLQATIGDLDLGEDFIPNVCKYLVGQLQRRSWESRVQKHSLALGLSVERMAELERFLDTASNVEMLWRSYYAHVEDEVPLQDVVSQFQSNRKDLDFLISVLGTEKPSKWVKNPKDKPYVVKKKRKTRKLSKLAPTPSSMTGSVERRTMTKTAVFDLSGVLAGIDKECHDFSRASCAYLCGFIDGKAFASYKKSAAKAGISKEILTQIASFIRKDDDIWKAYCWYVYYLGTSLEEASTMFDVPLVYLETVDRYKPLSFVFDFPRAVPPYV